MKIRNLIYAVFLMLIAGCNGWQHQAETEVLMGGYRTHGAANAILGSYGIRLRSGINQYQRIGVPGWDSIEIRHVATITLSKSSEIGLENLSGSLKDVGEIQANAEWVKDGKYKITFLQIYDLAKLRDEIIRSYDSNSKFARDIRNPEARFITAVGMIFDHKWTRKFEGGIGAGIDKMALSSISSLADLSISLKENKEETINISNNTVVAYQFVRICWDKNKEIHSLVRDLKGVDSKACPTGTTIKYSEA